MPTIAEQFENLSPEVQLDYEDQETGVRYRGAFKFKLVPSSNDRALAGRVRRDLWGGSQQLPQNPLCEDDFQRAAIRGQLAWMVRAAPQWYTDPQLGAELPDGLYAQLYELGSKEQERHAAERTRRAEVARKDLVTDKARTAES